MPYIELEEEQHQLLRELVRTNLPSPDGSETASALLTARGLDPDLLRRTLAGMPVGLVRTTAGEISVTAFGAAVFYRAEAERLELLLSRIAHFADVHGGAARRFAGCVRDMAQGALPPEDAQNRMDGTR
ncbi:hypothetical protein [Streptomyces profundus]|uniref:hypothetical protein n=1 Tax=Streptomyces profundus TaxID=2867410 RepID=UPI001D160FEB|nr:hypothetical protein [Streptomyces sp. MA3_2.13]UED85067.1 hypothetical protein K4G22_13375 [Streptomyces sp. MA3_2.13]